MPSIWTVLFFSLIGGVFSLAGGFLLLQSKRNATRLSTYATPFAAGALLAAAFFDLLKEANHEGSIETALNYALVGIVGFFILERFLHWFHHHHEHEGDHNTDPTASLIIIGDTLHNFIDGIAIGSAFLVDTRTGIIVTLAVAAHEIPQEIGDFGLLLAKGMRRKKVLLFNFMSALATTFAALLFFSLGQRFEIQLDVLLGLIAGMFIYIAASDIIPSIHENEKRTIAGPQTLMLLIGVVIVGFLTTTLHKYIEVDDHAHSDTELVEEHHHDDGHDH